MFLPEDRADSDMAYISAYFATVWQQTVPSY